MIEEEHSLKILIIYLLLYEAKKYNYKYLVTVYFISVGG